MGSLSSLDKYSLKVVSGIEIFPQLVNWLTRLFEVKGQLKQQLLELLRRSYKITDLIFGENEAILWGEDFTFPIKAINKFIYQFKYVGFDFDKLVGLKLKEISKKRLSSVSVVKALSHDNPELEKMLMIAKDGLPLFIDPNLTVNGPDFIPKISKTYQRTAVAVNKMLYEDFVVPGLAFILPGQLVRSKLDSFHLNRLSWTSKQGKAKGRPIVDCSAGKLNLNSIYTKEMSDRVWGIIKHPTISDLVMMVLEFFDSLNDANWNELVLWKMDLKGAYTLLSFQPNVVRYLGGELISGDYIFFLSGIFGWNGTPSAFQVVTRAIQFECDKQLAGKAKMYVYDLMGICLRSQVDSEINIITNICFTLFNSECIESSKTLIGRRLDFIGYTVDLDQRLISVSERNYLKCIMVFVQLI